MKVKCKGCSKTIRGIDDWRTHGITTRDGLYVEPSNCHCGGRLDCYECGSCEKHCECVCKKCLQVIENLGIIYRE